VRLGLNREVRDSVIRRINDSYGMLFSDRCSVDALEEFFGTLTASL